MIRNLKALMLAGMVLAAFRALAASSVQAAEGWWNQNGSKRSWWNVNAGGRDRNLYGPCYGTRTA